MIWSSISPTALESRGWFVGDMPLKKGRMGIDQVFHREANIEELFDALQADAFDVLADPGGMVGHAVHHFAVGF